MATNDTQSTQSTQPTDTTDIKQETQSVSTSDPIDATIQQTFLDKFRALTQENTNVPTYTPKSFQEQFYFQVGDILWVYMSGTWVQVGGGGIQTKNGSGTSPASPGTQQITCGFQPKFIRMILGSNIATSHCICIGSTDGTTEQSISKYAYGTNTYDSIEFSSVIANVYKNDGSSYVYANISSITSTGFVINWQTTGIQVTYQYEIYG